VLRILYRLAAVALIAWTGSAAGQGTHSFWIQPAGEAPQVFRAPANPPVLNGTPTNIQFSGGSGDSAVMIQFAQDTPLLPGYYQSPSWYGYGGVTALVFSHGGIACWPSGGRFSILEATYDGNTIIRFAADFEQHCGDGPATYGEVRYNSTIPLTVDRAGGWTDPTPFSIQPRALVDRGAEVVSVPVTVFGTNAASPITVANGAYSINGAPFTTAPGTVQPLDQVRLLVTAPAVFNATATATLTIGSMSADFAVSTIPMGTPVTMLHVESAGSSLMATPSATLGAPDRTATVQFDGSLLRVVFSQYTVPDYQVQLSPTTVGPKENADGNGFWMDPFPTLRFSTGSGRSCAGLGRFVVLESDIASDNTVNAFAANFEYACPGEPPVFGELRVNSAVPLTMQEPDGSTQPDPFRFTASPPMSPGVVATSDTTSVYGINAPAPISITGGEYSVNGGAFTAASGVVVNSDHLRVRGVAPATPGASQTVTVTVGGVSADFPITTYASGQLLTGLIVDPAAGDAVTGGKFVEDLAPAWSFYFPLAARGQVNAELFGPGGTTYVLGFGSGTTDLVTPSVLEAANVRLYGPSLDFHGPNPSACPRPEARFVILEADVDAFFGTPHHLAIDFDYQCGAERTYGELRYQSSVPFTKFKPAGSTLPDPFAFLDPGFVPPGSTVVSNTITLYGNNAPVAVNVTGGQYSVNGAPFTTAPGTANPLDRITLRAHVGDVPGSSALVTFNAGGRGASFHVASAATGQALSGLAMRGPLASPSQAAGWLAPATSFNVYSDYTRAVRFQATGMNTYTSMTFASPGHPTGAPLVPGLYTGTSNALFNTAGAAVLDVSGPAGSCSGGSGRFFVHEALYDNVGNISRFAADFEYRCTPDSPPTVGQVRYQSAVPLAPLFPSGCGRDTDADGVDDCVEWSSASNPLRRDNDIFGSTRLFAAQQYRDFLSREGDAGGVGYWTQALDNGTSTRAALVEQFLTSPEFQGRIAPMVRLYFASFNRIPDYDGLMYWIGQFGSGMPLETISGLFVQSPEFNAMYGGLDSAGFVRRVYQNVLGREPDAPGLAYWRGILDAGTLTRGQVMAAFSESPEYVGVSSDPVLVIMAYVGMLRRAPDVGGFNSWSNYLEAGNSPFALIQAFLDSAEYRGRFIE
jgi:hypothetical protein